MRKAAVGRLRSFLSHATSSSGEPVALARSVATRVRQTPAAWEAHGSLLETVGSVVRE